MVDPHGLLLWRKILLLGRLLVLNYRGLREALLLRRV